MNAEEKQIAIAGACGWIALKHDPELARRIHRFPPTNWVGISPIVQTMEHGKDESKDFNYWVVPNYCFDLNAMREAEMWLKNDRRSHDGTRFHNYMRRLTGCGGPGPCASATERADIFLDILGLNENTEPTPPEKEEK